MPTCVPQLYTQNDGLSWVKFDQDANTFLLRLPHRHSVMMEMKMTAQQLGFGKGISLRTYLLDRLRTGLFAHAVMPLCSVRMII